MKRLLILQNEGMILGGVWFVNKSISEKLVDLGYEVEILSIRNSCNPSKLDIDKRIKLTTINEVDLWGVIRKKEILKSLLKFKLVDAIKLYFKRIKQVKQLNNDYKKVKEYIRDIKPNYILSTHYQLLDAIPNEYLCKTIHEQHTSLYATKMIRDNIRVFNKYKDKIKFVWLTSSTCDEAVNSGYRNSVYIYNPVRFIKNEIASVSKNKRLITISRLSDEKRIDLMIDIVKDIFKDKKFSDWTFEIYGKGNLEKDIVSKIGDSKQIKFMGPTNEVEDKLLNSSIYLNTSLFEGFCLGVIEAAYCGVPTVAFDFGESILEEIIDDETGYIIEKDNIDDYKNKLKSLMRNEEKLVEMSGKCKDFASKFSIDNIINDWINLFDSFDK